MVKKCDKDARSAERQKRQAAFSLFRLLRKAPLLRTGVWQRCFSCVSGRAERLYRKNVPAEGLEIAQTGLRAIKDSSAHATNQPSTWCKLAEHATNQLSEWLKPTKRTTRASHAHGACQRNAPCKPAGHAAQANHAHGACERSALQANRVHNTNQPSTPRKPAEHAINRPRATKGQYCAAVSLRLWAMGYGPPSPPVFSSLVL